MTIVTCGSTLAATLLLCAAPSMAGVVITQENSDQGYDGKVTKKTQTISIEGSKQRASDGDGITILDMDKGVVLMINDKAKSYTEMPLKGSFYAMAGAMASQMKYKPKGTKKTVAGYSCDEYSVELMGDMAQCFSTSAPGAAEMYAFGKKMIEGMGGQLPAGMPKGVQLLQEITIQPPDLSAIYAQQDAQMAQMEEMAKRSPDMAKVVADLKKQRQQPKKMQPSVQRSVVTSIKTQSIPASAFEPPAGYQKQAAPANPLMGMPAPSKPAKH